MPDPWVICCAAGVCCDDGSSEQTEALAKLYREEMPKHTGAAYSPGLEIQFARITLQHFKLENRKELPPGVGPAKEVHVEPPPPVPQAPQEPPKKGSRKA